MTDLDFLIDAAAVSGQLATGMRSSVVAARTENRRLVIALAAPAAGPGRNPDWTASENEFLRASLGLLSEGEIAARLGRSAVAVHLRWKRDLRLPAPSKASHTLTLEQVAMGFGKDSHYTARLVDRGYLPARELPFERDGVQSRRVRVIERAAIAAFVLNPMHWMMLDPELLGRGPHRTNFLDPQWWERLRALALRRKALWGDEWWTPGQVAEYRGVSHSMVNKVIRLGRLPAVRWGNWWVLRSDAIAIQQIVAWHGKGGAGQDHFYVSPRADAFVVLALAAGLPHDRIGALMGWHGRQVEYRLRMLRQRGRLPWIVRHHNLPVIFNTRGDMLADWKRLARRFPRLGGAMRRLRSGHELEHVDLVIVRSVLSSWAKFHARTKEQRAIARSLKILGARQARHFRQIVRRMRAANIDPYRKLGNR